jgi:hypothetical protein
MRNCNYTHYNYSNIVMIINILFTLSEHIKTFRSMTHVLSI